MSTPVCLISELPVGATKQVIVDGKQVGLFHVRGTVYAIGNICSHAYAELHDGYVDDDDCTVDCPLHGARFDLKTGAHLTLPAMADVARYQVTVDATHIFVAPLEVQA
jgi:3-phenylpropionate/trans-cinnamate dioxygenase ferredoxin subunit